MQKPILIALAILLFLPNLFNKDIHSSSQFSKKENFDPRLSTLKSLQALELFADSIANSKNIQYNSFAYVELLETIIKNRFYHGFSHFTLSENWIAAVAGKWLKEDYACKVQPEKILQHNNAACSQQAIVLMALLRNKNISYRSVGFPHHYAMEVLINKNWHFFDADMEPIISEKERLLSSWSHQNDKLKKYYDPRHFSDLDFKFGTGLTATTGSINEIPAFNATAFHIITGILSKLLFLIPILLVFYAPFTFNFSSSPIRFKLKKETPSLAV